MADEPTDPFLPHVKATEYQRVIDQINALGQTFMSRFPNVEVQSWPFQREEAAAIVAAGNAAALEMAPFLATVCAVQYGEAEPADRLDQVKTKAALVNANGIAWTGMAAFANGLRARADDAIQAAATQNDVFAIVSGIISELEAFRTANGI
ncbi:hypothetical protein [Paradevosia shaoguanensis]|uniref:hypothetical protein n=1 Tax=Paradevosia shaoguanensis TaxID=1335043 RepID=UPI003C78A386